MDFPGFIAPFLAERFFAEVYDRSRCTSPPRARRASGGAPCCPGLGSTALFGIVAHWTGNNIQVIANGQAVPPDQYADAIQRSSGIIQRADPAKVHALLGMGASLVVDAVEEALPEIRRVTAMLSELLLGISGANVYCSFQGVQAFRRHCDLHDVFAVHCEGEKVWRIYENRAARPGRAADGRGRAGADRSLEGPRR